MEHHMLDFGRHMNQLSAADALTSMGEIKPQQKSCRRQPSKNNVHGLLSDLKSCSRKRDLQEGKQIHRNIVETGNESNIFIAAALITMYAKCGSMVDARRVFDNIKEPDVVSWNRLIMGYGENGECAVALECFYRMKSTRGCVPNSVTYVAAIKAYTSLTAHGDEAERREHLKWGRQIHSEIGHHVDHFVHSALINMYAKFGSMADARRVFESVKEPNVVSWTALILGYAENAEGQVALDFFSRMKTPRCTPNSVTYLAAIKACTSLAAHGKKGESLERGKEIHLGIGCHLTRFVQNRLVDMYSKCGSMKHAQWVFNDMQNPDVVSWNALILGYADNGEGRVALDLFSRMKVIRRCAPNSVTYLAAIKACSSLAVNGDGTSKSECLKYGRELHLDIGGHLSQSVQNALIDMYSKCGSMIDAKCVFDSISDPKVVSWTGLILGYADNEEGHVALDIFFRMQSMPRCSPNSVTYVAALKACGSIGALAIGLKLHSEITHFTIHVVTSLIDFYAKCGSMAEARAVFDTHVGARDITTWNALLAGYGRFGKSGLVFNLFEAMQDQGFRPDAVTFLCVLSCCSHAGLVEKAKKYLEAMTVQCGIVPTVMHYNCMVDVLGRANKLDEAVSLMRNPNEVTWTALLGACCKWNNVEVGRLAFQSLLNLDEKNVAAYVLMAKMYGSRGMWVEQEKVLKASRKFAHG